MRLTVGMDDADIEKTKEFANWLLDIGEGKVSGRNDGEVVIDIPEELLITDSIDPIGMPNHRLVLKVGIPIMLLRNLDQKNGLCNGTRLQVVTLGDRVIEAKVISGSNAGTRTFIPRINLSPSDKRIPFKLQRRQFPVSVCFAMTINKSQGQSLSKVGLFLRQPVFTHGQLYVALSRVKSMDGLKLLVLDVDWKITNKTTNVVYKEIFTNL
ncbi:ATP-dependent DNA helicase PIF1-like [Helianthus annuus]|uniref:ATP-dependent DNA helicase PIF1-like n=1 Tax=Helianthus annuus TaxID=4232 RepID=UPI000B90527D|nr:ATP-dependent DNA helicase PIF1-like [Helianthus annuus]